MGKLVSTLHARCPRLCPDFLPLQGSPASALAALCTGRSDKGLKAAIAESVASHSVCAVTGEPLGPGSRARVVGRWELDAAQLQCVLTACLVTTPQAARLTSTREMLSALSSDATAAEDAAAWARALAAANGVSHPTDTEARTWAQECYSLAYAIKVLATNLGEWSFGVRQAGGGVAHGAAAEEGVSRLLEEAGTAAQDKALRAASRSASKRGSASPERPTKRQPSHSSAQRTSKRRSAK